MHIKMIPVLDMLLPLFFCNHDCYYIVACAYIDSGYQHARTFTTACACIKWACLCSAAEFVEEGWLTLGLCSCFSISARLGETMVTHVMST